jgi:23S rRNA (uracil-5-)-methyltransferase RumA
MARRRRRPGSKRADPNRAAAPKNRTALRARPSFAGEVLPFELGQDGVSVRVGQKRLELPAGVPGDRVHVVPAAAPARGVVVERLLEPSPRRVVPPCPLLQRCGGCSLQAMDYRAQLEAKTRKLGRLLDGLGFSGAPPVEGLSRPFGFRTKLLMVAGGRRGALRLGFHRAGTHELVPAEGCPVQHPRSLAVLASARQVLDAHGVEPSHTRRSGPPGWLHAVGVRVDPGSGESELTLSGRTERVDAALVEQLNRLPAVSGVHLSINPTRSSYPMEGAFSTLAGRPRTAFSLGDERFLLSPGAFFQTSAEGAERLLHLVQSLLPDRFALLADLYAGAGLLALCTRQRWRRAVTVEANPSAVEDLRRHVQRAGFTRLTALSGRVEQRIAEVLNRDPELVLLDPPRRGCAPAVIEALIETRPAVVLYVACGVDALAAQARRLVEGGYRVTGAGAVDMFPHTAHLEVVVRLEAG